MYVSWCISRYALLGAASFLGGSMRMTVSLCVIMVEITNNLKLLPLIMLVLLISKVCFWIALHNYWWMLCEVTIVFHHCRLLVMLLMKVCMKYRPNWEAFHYWIPDLSTRWEKWQQGKLVEVRRLLLVKCFSFLSACSQGFCFRYDHECPSFKYKHK